MFARLGLLLALRSLGSCAAMKVKLLAVDARGRILRRIP